MLFHLINFVLLKQICYNCIIVCNEEFVSEREERVRGAAMNTMKVSPLCLNKVMFGDGSVFTAADNTSY